MDTDWLFLIAPLTPDEITNAAGTRAVLDAIRERGRWVKLLSAWAAYTRPALMEKARHLDLTFRIIRRSAQQKGFEVPSRRRVVARRFVWTAGRRCLIRDHKAYVVVSKVVIRVVIGGILPRRTTHP